MIAVAQTNVVEDAATIPYVDADEAYQLLSSELDRFLQLVDQLEPADWRQPTACTEWDVRDILAHQAGGYASGTGYLELFRQAIHLPKAGQLPEDALNEFQLRERADRTPQELIAELRQVGPIAARKWAYQFRLAKMFSMPHAVTGRLPFRHLFWIIHSRDTWMHRLDICRATGRKFYQTAEHDGRIAALVMRDVSDCLARTYSGPALIFELTGTAGGTWKIGVGEPAAAVRMDVLEFNIFASGRSNYEEARRKMTISGEVEAAERALSNLLVLY